MYLSVYRFAKGISAHVCSHWTLSSASCSSSVHWCHNSCRCWSKWPGALDSCLSHGLFRRIPQLPSYRFLVFFLSFKTWWKYFLPVEDFNPNLIYRTSQVSHWTLLVALLCEGVFLVTCDFLSLSIRVFDISISGTFYFWICCGGIDDAVQQEATCFRVIIRSLFHLIDYGCKYKR